MVLLGIGVDLLFLKKNSLFFLVDSLAVSITIISCLLSVIVRSLWSFFFNLFVQR